MNEETLRIKFSKKEILENLGYEKNDIFFEERIATGKRTDIHCTDEFGDIVFVIEFKKPGVDDLGYFEDDLKEKYVDELKADYGLLYNGRELIFYERQQKRLLRRNDISGGMSEIDEEMVSEGIRLLSKPDYGTTKIDNVLTYIDKFKPAEERLSLDTETSRGHFYESFRLKEDSLFSELVSSIINLFEQSRETSRFTKSAYEFWKRSYAKSLTKSQVPDHWAHVFEKAGLSPGKKEDRYLMTFALETAFALFMRLILTKSCEDYGFPDAHFSDLLENEVRRASRSDVDIAQSSYPKIATQIIRDMQEKLIASVFEEDIFYWWTEEFDRRSYQQFFSDTTLQMSTFGKNVAKLLLAIYKFDFSRVEGDPLGILYQRYFDTETRKALGEFYTPMEVVDYILDSVGYTGEQTVDRRLLDPACGSGTFLVEALKRYLDGAKRKAEQHGWGKVLDELCNRYHIVGFDIHPFATIMAQVQFTLALLPTYRKAKEEDPGFVLKRLPIFRTDSLAMEQQSGRMKITDFGVGKTFTMSIELPVQGDEGTFFEDDFRIPDIITVREHTDIQRTEEYFGALQAVFDTVKRDAVEERESVNLDRLERNLRHYLVDKKWSLLAEFFEDYAYDLLEKIKLLKSDFEDGRLVKSIEDVLLAALLKNFVDYDFVVGNPPYVRIQDIPEKQKNRWSGCYDWAKGNYDIFVPFIERGLKWIKGGHAGKLSYIVSNRFLLTNYGKPMRAGLPEQAQIDKLLDMKDSRVFEDALNYPAIFVFSKGPRRQHRFPVARVFRDSDDGEELLADVEHCFEQLENGDSHVVGDFSDAFYFPYDNLRAQGWYLMPPNEWKVFSQIEEGCSLLQDFTKTKSGGFQGVSTSKDDFYVLQLIEEREDTIVARPKGGGDPVEVEKGLVRPFLFGKDVERWRIDWKGWYVLFPYQQYVIDGEEKYKLIPSKEYEGKFDYGDTYIEDLYPKGWSYLESIEDDLRSREGGKFRRGKNQEHKWYGMGYPRSKDKYDKKKILVQLNSQEGDYCYDNEAKYVFQGGGKGGGIYGILLKSEKQFPFYLTGLLNSSLLDFYLKHISTIYAGKSYSYADAYIKLLPIKTAEKDGELDFLEEIKEVAEQIVGIEELKRKIDMFPTPYFSALRKKDVVDEFFEIRHTTKRYYREASISIQTGLDEGKKIKLGKDDYIDDYRINTDEKYEYIARTLNGKKLSKEEEIIIRVPVNNELVQQILEMHDQDIGKLRDMPTVAELEDKLNQTVFDLYNIESEDDIAVIDTFLDRF